MSQKIEYQYFYGNESDMYTFYRIPKLLITDEAFKTLTSDAKILYGLMLDRMSLSSKNGWFDKENRVYIYFSIEDTMEYLNVGKNKALKTIQELDQDTGIGLIERVKQGQGKPAIIYVKNFVTESAEKSGSEVYNVNLKTPTNQTSRSLQDKPQDVYESNSNNTNINNTEFNNTESNLILSMEKPIGLKLDIDVNAYAELIRENLEIDHLIANNPFDAEMLQGIYELVLETVVCQRDTIVIEGTSYPISIVKSKFMRLNSSHVEYVMDSLKCTTSKIRNIKKYLLACLFNAPTTMSSYYQQAVNHDVPQYAKAR